MLPMMQRQTILVEKFVVIYLMLTFATVDYIGRTKKKDVGCMWMPAIFNTMNISCIILRLLTAATLDLKRWYDAI